GRFSGELDIPRHLEAGDYRLVAQAWNEQRDYHETASATIPVAAPDVDIEWTTEPPMDQVRPAGTPVRMTVTIHNRSTQDLWDATFVIEETNSGGEMARSTINVPAGETFTRTFPSVLP